MANTYIYRDATSSTAVQKATISFWIKRSKLGASQYAFYCGDTSSYSDRNFYISFHSSDRMYIRQENSGTALDFITTRKFRDVGAWMNVVVKLDLTETGNDRVKLYINGVQETAFDTQTAMTGSEWWTGKTGYRQFIGYSPGEGTYLDGCLSHFQYVDGLALAPTEFGEVDSTSGIWKLKTGSYATPGTNGFHLKMEDSTNMDLDSSSNAHTFSTSGTLTATLDNPDNNFCTMNPIASKYISATPPIMSDGNLTLTDATSSVGDWGGFCTLAVSKGKWYWEVKNVEYNSNNLYHGLGQINLYPINPNGGSSANTEIYGFRIYNADGSVIIYGNGSTESTSTSTTNGDIFGIKMDLDNGYWYLSKNGTFLNSGNAINGTQIPTSDSTWYAPYQARHQNPSNPNISSYNFGNGYFGTTAITTNSGAGYADDAGEGKFNYTVPTGYYALCTNNIATYG